MGNLAFDRGWFGRSRRYAAALSIVAGAGLVWTLSAASDVIVVDTPVERLGEFGLLHGAMYAPDGESLITWGSRGVFVRDMDSGAVTHALDGIQGGVFDFALSPDGQSFFHYSEWDVKVYRRDFATGAVLATYPGASTRVLSLALSPDGSRLATGTEQMIPNNAVLRIWDVDEVEVLHQITAHPQTIRSLAFSPDGSELLSGGAEMVMRLWNVTTGQEVDNYQGFNEDLYRVGFSPAGDRVLSAGRFTNSVRVWNKATRAVLGTIEGRDGDFSSDGNSLLLALPDGTISQVEIVTGDEEKRFESHDWNAFSARYSNDFSEVLSIGRDNTIRRWDTDTSDQIALYDGYTGSFRGVVHSPDDQFIATYDHDGQVAVWDRSTLVLIQNFRVRANNITFSSDGTMLAAACFSSTVVWNTSDWSEVLTIPSGFEFDSVAFSPDGSHLLTGRRGANPVSLWEVSSGDLIRHFTPSITSGPVMVAISPDSSMVAATGNDSAVSKAYLLDADSGAVLHEFITPTSSQSFRAVAFSPNSTQLMISTASRTIIRDVSTGNTLYDYGGGGLALSGNGFSPDGERFHAQGVIIGSPGPIAGVWDLGTGEGLIRYEGGHTRAIAGTAISPDGSSLWSAGEDGIVLEWDASYSVTGTNWALY